MEKWILIIEEDEESHLMWRHKNEGLSIYFLGIFFLTPPLTNPSHIFMKFFWGTFFVFIIETFQQKSDFLKHEKKRFEDRTLLV